MGSRTTDSAGAESISFDLANFVLVAFYTNLDDSDHS
jgi:hypothetical protein